MTRQIFYLKLIVNCYKKFVDAVILKRNDNNSMILLTKPRYGYNLIKTLKTNSLTQVRVLNDICVVDYPERANRFEINYNFLSVKYNFRLFIKSYTSAYVNSITNLFDSAN
jgi:NADH:ubiquinone oxidoreductase subunit C